jgi:hypothetical protein
MQPGLNSKPGVKTLSEGHTMILGIEIALTIYGIYLLATGKSMGKNSFSHWQLRLIGAFLLTLFPIVLATALIFGVVWMVMYPDANPDTLATDLRWQIVGIEFGIVILYAAIAILWERTLRKRVERGH